MIVIGDARGDLGVEEPENPSAHQSPHLIARLFSRRRGSGIDDGTTKFLSTKTWQVQGNPVKSNDLVGPRVCSDEKIFQRQVSNLHIPVETDFHSVAVTTWARMLSKLR